jgi:hypothetical protein
MTKREIRTISNLFFHGVSEDVCRTALIQRCCPSLSMKQVNALSNALNEFYNQILEMKDSDKMESSE